MDTPALTTTCAFWMSWAVCSTLYNFVLGFWTAPITLRGIRSGKTMTLATDVKICLWSWPLTKVGVGSPAVTERVMKGWQKNKQTHTQPRPRARPLARPHARTPARTQNATQRTRRTRIRLHASWGRLSPAHFCLASSTHFSPHPLEAASIPICALAGLALVRLDDGWPESVKEQGFLLLVWRHHITKQ